MDAPLHGTEVCKRRRPKKPRKVADMSPKGEPGKRPRVHIIRLYWENPAYFHADAYAHILRYLEKHKCIYRCHPQDMDQPKGSPNTTIYVTIDRFDRYLNAIKQEVHRYGCGMRFEQVDRDPFEDLGDFSGQVASDFQEGRLQKGA